MLSQMSIQKELLGAALLIRIRLLRQELLGKLGKEGVAPVPKQSTSQLLPSF